MPKISEECYERNQTEIDNDVNIINGIVRNIDFNTHHWFLLGNQMRIIYMLRHMEDRLEEIEKRLIER